MKRQFFAFFLVALIAELSASWVEWHQLGDCLKRMYQESFLTFELVRMTPWISIFLLAAIAWVIINKILFSGDGEAGGR